MNLIDNSHILKKIYANCFNSLTSKFDITQNELTIIVYLKESNDDNNTAKDIVDTFLFSKSHVSQSVDSLLKKNLIYKKGDKKDKKKMHLYLTENSAPIIQEAINQKELLLKNIFDGFSEEDINNLKSYSSKIFKNIKRFYE